jgi:hypothetical protein
VNENTPMTPGELDAVRKLCEAIDTSRWSFQKPFDYWIPAICTGEADEFGDYYSVGDDGYQHAIEMAKAAPRLLATIAERDRTIAELFRQVKHATELLHTTVADQCADDTAIRDIAKSVLPAADVDGDSYSVPGIVDVVRMAVERLRTELARSV